MAQRTAGIGVGTANRPQKPGPFAHRGSTMLGDGSRIRRSGRLAPTWIR